VKDQGSETAFQWFKWFWHPK